MGLGSLTIGRQRLRDGSAIPNATNASYSVIATAVVGHPRLRGRSSNNGLVRLPADFVTLPLQKTKSAVTGILLQGPDTSTGRVRLGCGTEKLIMTLTSREWEVATLVAKGLSNKQIARHLNVGEGTVKIHLHNIYGKLAVKNRTVLALMTQRVIESGCSEDRKGGAALAEAVAAA
jgi:DNA-binding CsgD family transcriptional regulator